MIIIMVLIRIRIRVKMIMIIIIIISGRRAEAFDLQARYLFFCLDEDMLAACKATISIITTTITV